MVKRSKKFSSSNCKIVIAIIERFFIVDILCIRFHEFHRHSDLPGNLPYVNSSERTFNFFPVSRVFMSWFKAR